VDFAQHKLLNLYYITPDGNDYLEKRDEFGKMKDIKNYSVSFGLIISGPYQNGLVFCFG
jgi:hypothetical protein